MIDSTNSKSNIRQENLLQDTGMATNLIETGKKSNSNDSHVIVQNQFEAIEGEDDSNKNFLTNRTAKLVLTIIPICMMSTCVEYSYNIHQQLGDGLLRYLKITPGQVELFYTLYSVGLLPPLLVSSFLCGKLGKSFLSVVSSGLMFCALVFVCLGVFNKSLQLIQVAWLCAGFFGNIIYIPQATIISDLFTGKNLSIVIGLTNTFNLFSNSFSNFLNPSIFLATRNIVVSYFMVGVWVFGVFFLCSVFFFMQYTGFIDFLTEENEEELMLKSTYRVKENMGKSLGLTNSQRSGVGNNQESQGAEDDLGDGGGEVQRKSKNSRNSRSRRTTGSNNSSMESRDINRGFYFWRNKPVVKDIFQPLPLLCLINYLIAVNINMLFVSFSTNCFIVRFGFPLVNAKNFVTVGNFTCIPFIMFYSFLAQKKGRKMVLLSLGYCVAGLAFLMLTLLPNKTNPMGIYLCMILLSQFTAISYGICASALMLVCPQRSTSLAWTAQCFSMTVFTIILSLYIKQIIDGDTAIGYQIALLSMVGLCVIGLVFSGATYWVDKQRGGILFYHEHSKRVSKLKRRLNKYGYLPKRKGVKGKKKKISGKGKARKGTKQSISVGLTKYATTKLAPSESKPQKEGEKKKEYMLHKG